ALYMELKKQLELVKIEEIKNVPVVSIMDPARPAGEKTKPRRSIIVIVATFLSGVIGVAYVLVQQYYGRQIADILQVFRKKETESKNEREGDE
ncbi:MAG TPA: GNVR domain-containing protein, partial [Bacteroidota bacterium]